MSSNESTATGLRVLARVVYELHRLTGMPNRGCLAHALAERAAVPADSTVVCDARIAFLQAKHVETRSQT